MPPGGGYNIPHMNARTIVIFSSFQIQWRGVRRLSVCPSVNFCANRFFLQTNGRIATKLSQDGLQDWSACIHGVLKVKVKVKCHVIRALFWILGMSYSVIDGLVLFPGKYKMQQSSATLTVHSTLGSLVTVLEAKCQDYERGVAVLLHRLDLRHQPSALNGKHAQLQVDKVVVSWNLVAFTSVGTFDRIRQRLIAQINDVLAVRNYVCSLISQYRAAETTHDIWAKYYI